MKRLLSVLLYLSRFFELCALVLGILVGLGEALISGFVCVDSCPAAMTIFPWYLSSALRLLLPIAAPLLLAYLLFVGYCLANAQRRRALAPTVALVLGAALSVGAIVAYSHFYVTLMPLDDGYLIDGPAQRWNAGLGFIVVALACVWAGALIYLQWPPDRRRRAPGGARRDFFSELGLYDDTEE